MKNLLLLSVFMNISCATIGHISDNRIKSYRSPSGDSVISKILFIKSEVDSHNNILKLFEYDNVHYLFFIGGLDEESPFNSISSSFQDYLDNGITDNISKLVILMRSGGGMLQPAKKISEKIRGLKIETITISAEMCASACLLLMSSGNYNYVLRNTLIGAHSCSSDEVGGDNLKMSDLNATDLFIQEIEKNGVKKEWLEQNRSTYFANKNIKAIPHEVAIEANLISGILNSIEDVVPAEVLQSFSK